MPRLRVCCVQLDPVHGDVAASQGRADALLAHLCADVAGGSPPPHVVLLPEMAFTGYLFASREAVLPFAEVAGAGSTASWCAALARRVGAHVACGYVELCPSGVLGGDTTRPPAADSPAVATSAEMTAEAAESPVLYNSLLLLGPDGRVLANHRKVHLFSADKSWATEGTAWTSALLPSLGVRVALAVCMDINPYEFTAPWAAHELANAVLAQGAGLLLFASAWCNRSPDDPPDHDPPVDAPETQRYWAARLAPLAASRGAATAFVVADRVGSEGGSTFCGGSCCMQLGGGAARLVASLGGAGEGLLEAEVDVRPA